MSESGSVALWCTTQPAAGHNCSFEAHFNYWRLLGDTSFKAKAGTEAKDFLEIGILLSDPGLAQKIDIFIPEQFDTTKIEDCGERFADPTIAQGIFNEVLSPTTSPNPSPSYVDLHGSGLLYRVHRFLKSAAGIDASELTVAARDGGTLISILPAALTSACAALPADGKVYFRLRIYFNPDPANVFVKVIKPKDRAFQSGFSEVEYVDFRFNEARTLPTIIESMMRLAPNKAPVTKVAFLTAVPVRATLTASNSEWHKSRLLEHQIWDKYVSSGIPDGMMVYHWRKEHASIGDFSCFVKLETRRTDRKTMLTYLGVAFAFGVLGNLFASFICWICGKL